jgi:hypothetical protein
VPSNLLLQRYGARAWLTRIMLAWGVVATAMAFVTSATGFYALRLLLGVAEAGFFPGVVYYFTQWLPATERGKAMAIFLSGSAIASILSARLGRPARQALGLPGGCSDRGPRVRRSRVTLSTPRRMLRWLSPRARRTSGDRARAAPAEAAVRPPSVRRCATAICCSRSCTLRGAHHLRTTVLAAEHHPQDGPLDFQVGLFNSVPG